MRRAIELAAMSAKVVAPRGGGHCATVRFGWWHLGSRRATIAQRATRCTKRSCCASRRWHVLSASDGMSSLKGRQSLTKCKQLREEREHSSNGPAPSAEIDSTKAATKRAASDAAVDQGPSETATNALDVLTTTVPSTVGIGQEDRGKHHLCAGCDAYVSVEPCAMARWPSCTRAYDESSMRSPLQMRVRSLALPLAHRAVGQPPLSSGA